MKSIDAGRFVQEDDSDNDEIVSVAKEIIEYLHEHPNAADSLDGVVNWWLARQRLKSARDTVKRALDYLIDRGMVYKKTHEGSSAVYSNVPTDDGQTKH